MAAKPKDPWQTISIRPFTGTLDTRSEPESVALGAFRWKQNFTMTGGTKLCCRGGHDKLFSSYSPYTNFDLHDQSDNNGIVTPEYITMLFKGFLNTGQRFLYAGSQSRIQWLDETTGLWTTVARGMGGTPQPGLPAIRFQAAELQEQILFTNNFDQPLLSAVGSGSTGPIPDLVTLQVTQAAVTIQWAGFLFLMNVEQGGVRKSSRVRWSDLNNPTVWIAQPNVNVPGSLAGFQDLDYGSTILGAAIMANGLYIFTDQAIWVCFPSGASLSGGTPAVFGFTRIYSEPKNGAKCLMYPNTLVSEGNSVWYGASDGLYYFDPYTPEPVREEWLYRGTSLVYNDALSALSPECCQSPVAEIFPDTQEIWLSWPEVSANPGGSCLNSKTVVWNYAYKSIDIVDFGYSAFCNYIPNSMASDTSNCPPDAVFIGASMVDKCLKSIGGIYSRNVCTNAATGRGTIVDGVFTPFVGQYSYVGYYRILRGLLPTLNFDRDKFIRHFLLETQTTAQAVPCVIKLRIGVSYSETDPNLPDGLCSTLWHPLPDMPLVCRDTMTAAQYVSDNIMRNSATEWNMLWKGRFIFFEVTIANSDGSPAIGGSACFPRCEMQIRLAPN